MSAPRVLIVDDDEAFIDTYVDLLSAEGYDTTAARNADEAQALAAAGEWDVVILDQKLQGGAGPDGGLDLVPALQAAAPGAKIIMATAYALPATIERAFSAGVYDYLEKGPLLPTLLRVKVRNAAEATRERRLTTTSPQMLEADLRAKWAATLAETETHRKGALLEQAIELLLRTIAGFQVTQKNRSTADEEIDLYVRNSSLDPFWQKESTYLLVECKHWTKPVDPAELGRLFSKMGRRYGRCHLGIFVAVGGWTKGFETTLLAKREGDRLVIPLDRSDVDRLVHSVDRGGLLQSLHERASLGPE